MCIEEKESSTGCYAPGSKASSAELLRGDMWFGIGSFAACTSIGLHFNWTTIGSVLFGSQLPRFCEVRAVASSSMNPLQGLLFVQCWLIKVERDTFCQEILMHRMLEGHLPNVPIFDDVESFKGTPGLVKLMESQLASPVKSFCLAYMLKCLTLSCLYVFLLSCLYIFDGRGPAKLESVSEYVIPAPVLSVICFGYWMRVLRSLSL